MGVGVRSYFWVGVIRGANFMGRQSGWRPG